MSLKEIIADRGIKQVEIAKALNLSESQVSLLLSGDRRLSLECAARLARILHISIDEIFLAVDFAKRNAPSA